MRIGRTHILVLNHNGRALLGECMPSVVAAAARCPIPCAVSVVENASTDGSLEALSQQWPNVTIIRASNRGLVSFNHVMAQLTEPVVVLLNNDVKLDPDALAPLLETLDRHPDAFFAAPQCWTFDGQCYEGMRTRVRSRFGLVQGMSRVPGFERQVNTFGLTAAAGPVLAIDRKKFLEIGGYHPIYQPGRLEDLDLGFLGWMSGWKGYYVPDSRAYHKGFASFGPAFGQSGCDRITARNTLLFAWKNLAGRRLWCHLAWLPARLVVALARGRVSFLSAFADALVRLPAAFDARRALAVGRHDWTTRQEAFFQQFTWQ